MVDESEEDVSAVVEKAALLNATKHNGKAEVGAVVGRVLAEVPGLRSKAGLVSKESALAVKRINSMSL